MSELVEKFSVGDGLYIYLQSNSKVWIARFKIGGKWIARTTKQRDRDKATVAAIKVQDECQIKHEHEPPRILRRLLRLRMEPT